MYKADEKRYEKMDYIRCGSSGLKLPELSLGLWHNFGDGKDEKVMFDIISRAFDLGITHFDLANNYGPAPGSAETNFGKILKNGLSSYRDEMIISTKAGYDMWPGPYGDFGSKKYLIASCDQSLKRLGLEYVDIFYHHRPDPNTPLEETMGALAQIVRSGKALYVGLSNYKLEDALVAQSILTSMGVPSIIDQVCINMLNRDMEDDNLLIGLEECGMGSIIFSPLAQGLLTNKYLSGNAPKGSRATQNKFLSEKQLTPEMIKKLNDLNEIAKKRGQTLAQMAITWLLDKRNVTSVLIGASSVAQLEENYSALQTNREFSYEELALIDKIALS